MRIADVRSSGYAMPNEAATSKISRWLFQAMTYTRFMSAVKPEAYRLHEWMQGRPQAARS